MKQGMHKLTLIQPATYQIKVSGHLETGWTEWTGGAALALESEGGGLPVTVLTGIFDQAALQGLLRRLYALGLPLISVHWVASD
jgi:hypothetical protein